MAIIKSNVGATPTSKRGRSSAPVAPRSSDFVPAVCVDVIRLGEVQTAWGPKPKVKLVFELAERNESGYPSTTSRTFNITTSRWGELPQALESWFGHRLEPGEIGACVYDDWLINRPCRVYMKPAKQSDGRSFSFIDEIRPSSGERLNPSGLYRRWIK